VGRLKDHLGLVEGRLLGMLLAEAAASSYGSGTRRPDFLVPVPLHPLRLARRGHNQAVVLAVPVARRLEVPLLRGALQRRGGGRHQRGLSRRDRLDNLMMRFTCRYAWSQAPCVAVVDDVLTTGATAAAVATELLAAGAGEVHVLCATRTPRLTGQT
jgi:ComF family protein